MWTYDSIKILLYILDSTGNLESEKKESSICDDFVKVDGKDGLLFVYQEPWQKRLLERYGNELSLLDATYRTTRYALPLFFLVVKTNVDYQVVGVFVTESETEDAITEALSIIKDWNPKWNPRYFMTDYSLEEINSIRNNFGTYIIYLVNHYGSNYKWH